MRDRGGVVLTYSTTDPSGLAGWTYDGFLCTACDSADTACSLTANTSLPKPVIGSMWECPVLVPLSEPGATGWWNPARTPEEEAAAAAEAAEDAVPAPAAAAVGPVLCMLMVSPDRPSNKARKGGSSAARPRIIAFDLQLHPRTHACAARTLTHSCITRPPLPQVIYYVGCYARGHFDLAGASGPWVMDEGDVLYAPNLMLCPRGRPLVLGWFQERDLPRAREFGLLRSAPAAQAALAVDRMEGQPGGEPLDSQAQMRAIEQAAVPDSSSDGDAEGAGGGGYTSAWSGGSAGWVDANNGGGGESGGGSPQQQQQQRQKHPAEGNHQRLDNAGAVGGSPEAACAAAAADAATAAGTGPSQGRTEFGGIVYSSVADADAALEAAEAAGYSGCLTLPRVISLSPCATRVLQLPPPELEALRQRPLFQPLRGDRVLHARPLFLPLPAGCGDDPPPAPLLACFLASLRSSLPPRHCTFLRLASLGAEAAHYSLLLVRRRS